MEASGASGLLGSAGMEAKGASGLLGWAGMDSVFHFGRVYGKNHFGARKKGPYIYTNRLPRLSGDFSII